MKNTLLITLLILLTSCGGQPGSPGKDGTGCTVKQLATGALISCSDGSFAQIYNGQDGKEGSSCTTSSIPTGANISCTDGTDMTILNGTNGQNCIITQLSNGVKISCGTQIAYIYNGQDAPVTAFSFVKEITPCGAASSPWKEVLLCMTNGNVLASFSDSASGLNTRLSNITTGTYQDTDNSGCHFTVTMDGNNTIVSWLSGSNQYSSWYDTTVTCIAN